MKKILEIATVTNQRTDSTLLSNEFVGRCKLHEHLICQAVQRLVI